MNARLTTLFEEIETYKNLLLTCDQPPEDDEDKDLSLDFQGNESTPKKTQAYAKTNNCQS